MFDPFHIIIAVFMGFGLAIALVEKGRDWPIRRFRLRLMVLLKSIHPRLPRMLGCVVCTSFWTTLLADVFVCVFSGFCYWSWPISGFIALGLTWSVYKIIETMNTPSIILSRKEE